MTYFFKLPESASNFQDIEQIIDKVSDVKKRFNLKDTIAKSEDGNEIGYRGLTVSYKNQVRQINTDDTIYLKSNDLTMTTNWLRQNI